MEKQKMTAKNDWLKGDFIIATITSKEGVQTTLRGIIESVDINNRLCTIEGGFLLSYGDESVEVERQENITSLNSFKRLKSMRNHPSYQGKR